MAKSGVRCVRDTFDRQEILKEKIARVDFEVNQICKESQGVYLKGFIIWTTDDKEGGPLKLQQSFRGTGSDPMLARNCIKLMSEGFIRDEVANTPLETLIGDHGALRTTLMEKIQPKARG